ncbi:MAG: hypothetical protein RLZZ50_290 [Verrucomicrobiota bacterium]
MMIVNWAYLAVGLLFGLIPALRLLNTECRYLIFEDLWNRLFKSRGEGEKKRRRWWKLPLVWIDPFRGYVVGDMLGQSFRAAPKANFAQAQLPVIAMLVAVLLVLSVQMRGRPYERESISPAGFMVGLMLALMAPTIAIGAIIVGAATMIALQSYLHGYLAAGVITALLGVAFMGPVNSKVVAFTLIVSGPAWISWLRGTSMVTPVRC